MGGRKQNNLKQVCGILEMLEERLPKTVKNYKTVEKREESVARRECLCGRGQRYMGDENGISTNIKRQDQRLKQVNISDFIVT